MCADDAGDAGDACAACADDADDADGDHEKRFDAFRVARLKLVSASGRAAAAAAVAGKTVVEAPARGAQLSLVRESSSRTFLNLDAIAVGIRENVEAVDPKANEAKEISIFGEIFRARMHEFRISADFARRPLSLARVPSFRT